MDQFLSTQTLKKKLKNLKQGAPVLLFIFLSEPNMKIEAKKQRKTFWSVTLFDYTEERKKQEKNQSV